MSAVHRWSLSPAAGADVPAPAAGTTARLGHGRHADAPSRAASWPRRPTCSALIPRPGPGLAFAACVLPPGHTGTTCLPAPGQPTVGAA